MTSLLPDVRSGGLPVLRAQRVSRELTKTQMEVFRYQLAGRASAEMDRIDSEALSDAVRFSFEEEVGTLRIGLNLANGNPAALQLLSEKLEIQSRLNNRRIQRRFGA